MQIVVETVGEYVDSNDGYKYNCDNEHFTIWEHQHAIGTKLQ